MRAVGLLWHALLVVVLCASLTEGRKTFSTRRKSGGNGRRGQPSQKHAPPPGTPHHTDSSSSSTFLNSERASSNTHHRADPFAKQPQTNGPIGFEKVQGQGGQRQLGFDKVNSEVQHKPSAPAYPGKPSAPNGPPPAYPGYGSPGYGSHGGHEAPPAYPGRPVNAPPVYSANSPSYPQRTPGVGGYPQQNSPYPQQQWTQPGQQGFGYPNTGSYPNQGFGSYPSGGGYGGYGQSHAGGFGGNPYGGAPYGHSNSYGGSPFGGSPFGGSPFGGSPFGGSPGYGGGHGFGGGQGFGGMGGFGGGGYGSPHYSPNNFGYSSKPGLFGSLFGGHSNNQYGYHKRSRFGGLPIPIPIPIPIPMGMFGGRSHNHRVLDTFMKNQTVDDSDNSTAVYILNNATVAPCTTDQFLYDSLNVTVMSCTADNCTAVKIFTTTNISGELTVRLAGLTLCLEDNTTYSSFADNINPTVSDLQEYWMTVCQNTSGGGTPAQTVTYTVLNKTDDSLPTPLPVESTTTRTPTEPSPSTSCEVFNCSSIEICLPPVEIVDTCTTPDCPFTRRGFHPCLQIKMCKSPTTPISTFATLNTTLSRIDQFNNVVNVHDIANLTLISYMPPSLPANCSQEAEDPACHSAQSSAPAEDAPRVCAPGHPLEADPDTGAPCTPPVEATTKVPSVSDAVPSPADMAVG